MAAAKILIVDDDALLLQPLSRILSMNQYEVFPATRPKQALEIIGNGPLIDVMLSDIVMPEMRGTDLVREVARISPRTASVLMTAAPIDPADIPAGVQLLKKPFRKADLISAVEAALVR